MFFFYDGYYNFYNRWGSGVDVGGREMFFWQKCFFVLFHQCNNSNLHNSWFIFVYVHILHIVNIIILRYVFPSPEKLHFGH